MRVSLETPVTNLEMRLQEEYGAPQISVGDWGNVTVYPPNKGLMNVSLWGAAGNIQLPDDSVLLHNIDTVALSGDLESFAVARTDSGLYTDVRGNAVSMTVNDYDVLHPSFGADLWGVFLVVSVIFGIPSTILDAFGILKWVKRRFGSSSRPRKKPTFHRTHRKSKPMRR